MQAEGYGGDLYKKKNLITNTRVYSDLCRIHQLVWFMLM